MVRVLLTGISGVGKSTVIGALMARGVVAIDLDSDRWSHWAAVDPDEDPTVTGTPVEPDRDWVWQEDRVDVLLRASAAAVLVVAGCAANQGKFRARFDRVVVLTAPAAVIRDRLAMRTTNAYGKRPEEAERVIALIDTVEDLLRRGADHVIDTAQPLAAVVERVLAIIAEARAAERSEGVGGTE